jgi:hypothetical protein
MKIGIVGYRKFNNYSIFCESMTEIHKKFPIQDWDNIISGGASGADTLAKKYANDNNIDFIEHPANWHKYGSPSAAYIRNQKIVDESDMIIAFIHSSSKGTWDTINRATRADKLIKIIKVS